MTSESTQALQLFIEYYDQLLAVVRQRFAVAWQFYREEQPQLKIPELMDQVDEFGRLLRVVLRYGLLDALKEEAGWYAALFAARGAGKEALTLLLDSWLVAIQGLIKPPECHFLALPLQVLRAELPNLLAAGQARLRVPPDPALAQFVDLLTQGEAVAAQEQLFRRLHRGTPPDEIITDLLVPAMAEIGRRWEQNTLAIYQEHLATEVVVRLLYGLLSYQPPAAPIGPLALVTCVPGDEHQLLPLALGLYLELRGWRVRTLGRSLPLDQIGAAATAFKPQVIFLSLAMLSRLEEALDTVSYLQALDQAGRLIMGGPGTQAAAHILAKTGVMVVKTFAEAHAAGLSRDWHA